MRYKSIWEQNEKFISILKQNNDLMLILDYITELNLPNFYIERTYLIVAYMVQKIRVIFIFFSDFPNFKQSQ